MTLQTRFQTELVRRIVLIPAGWSCENPQNTENHRKIITLEPFRKMKIRTILKLRHSKILLDIFISIEHT